MTTYTVNIDRNESSENIGTFIVSVGLSIPKIGIQTQFT